MNKEDVEFAKEYVGYINSLKESGEDIIRYTKTIDEKAPKLMGKDELSEHVKDAVADQIIDNFLQSKPKSSL